MQISQFTHHRRKLLVGLAACVCIGCWLSGSSDLALHSRERSSASNRPRGAAARAERTQARSRTTPSTPRRLVRSAALADADELPRSRALAHPAPRYVRRPEPVEEAPEQPSGPVIPPSYRERLALLEEEREVLMSRISRERELPSADEEDEVIPAVAYEDGAAAVEPALAEAADPQEFRQVTPVRVRFLGVDPEPAALSRGARLLGVIETE